MGSQMAHAIRMYETGGPEVMRWEPIDVGAPRPGQVRLRHALASELFGHVAAGRIKIEINQRYELPDAAQAHRDLEARKTTGSSVFTV